MTSKIIPTDVRKIILQQSKRANVGHIGSALSVVEILSAIYSGALKIDDFSDPDRDRFVLSKGHAALALYAVLHLRGAISHAELETFLCNDSLLGVHPEYQLHGVDFSSGSLGQGLSLGAGAALAGRLLNSRRRVFVVMSDAECNEGSIWEAAMFAAHRKLGNLIAIIDLNGQQAFGYTRDVCSMPNMADRWKSFGWNVQEVDGHNMSALDDALERCKVEQHSPHLIVAQTTFGKGVSFMENQIKWHYLPMSDDEFTQAMKEVCS
jgi:transketolase